MQFDLDRSKPKKEAPADIYVIMPPVTDDVKREPMQIQDPKAEIKRRFRQSFCVYVYFL